MSFHKSHRQAKVVLWLCLSAFISSLALPITQAGAEPNWMIGPNPGLPAELAAKAEKTLTLSTEVAKIKVVFSCTGVSLDSALIEAPGNASGKALFSGCKTQLNGSTSALCEPLTGAGKGLIASGSLKGQLLSHEGAALLKVTAVAGETLAVIKTSEECSIGEEIPVIGPLYLKDAGGEFEAEKITHVLETGPLTELWVISKTAEHKATAGGSVAVSLTGGNSGSPWSGLGA